MDFIEATDVLLKVVRAEDLADALDVKAQNIRQARIASRDFKKGYRTPPAGWEKAVIKLAEQHSKELAGLATQLRKEINNKG